jgi:hypothetical protein
MHDGDKICIFSINRIRPTNARIIFNIRNYTICGCQHWSIFWYYEIYRISKGDKIQKWHFTRNQKVYFVSYRDPVHCVSLVVQYLCFENTLVPGAIKQQEQNNATFVKIRTGSFVGAGDGFHNAEGLAKIIPLADGSTILRLENFKSTN